MGIRVVNGQSTLRQNHEQTAYDGRKALKGWSTSDSNYGSLFLGEAGLRR